MTDQTPDPEADDGLIEPEPEPEPETPATARPVAKPRRPLEVQLSKKDRDLLESVQRDNQAIREALFSQDEEQPEPVAPDSSIVEPPPPPAPSQESNQVTEEKKKRRFY